MIEFGRLPALAHKQRGERRLGTFAFPGSHPLRGWTGDGRFVVKRKTQRQRLTVKLSRCATSTDGSVRCCVAIMPISGCRATSGRFRRSPITCDTSGSAPCIGGVSDGSRDRRSRRCWPDSPYRNLGSLIRVWRDRLPRVDFHEEPYAGNPHVRICEGEAEWLSYSTSPTGGSPVL